nr:serine/arginine repetitive matrix protein 3-like [Peromyscus maniculatus bairdii]
MPFLGWARTHALGSRADAGREHRVAEAAARTAAGSGSVARRTPRARLTRAHGRSRADRPRAPHSPEPAGRSRRAPLPAPRPLSALAAAARPLGCWRLTVKSRSERSHRETAAGSHCGTGRRRRRRRRRQGSRRRHCACAQAAAAPADPGRGAGAGRRSERVHFPGTDGSSELPQPTLKAMRAEGWHSLVGGRRFSSGTLETILFLRLRPEM